MRSLRTVLVAAACLVDAPSDPMGLASEGDAAGREATAAQPPAPDWVRGKLDKVE